VVDLDVCTAAQPDILDGFTTLADERADLHALHSDDLEARRVDTWRCRSTIFLEVLEPIWQGRWIAHLIPLGLLFLFVITLLRCRTWWRWILRRRNWRFS